MYHLTKAQAKKVVENGTRLTFDYCRENNIHYLVTGSSGGLDSALTLGFVEQVCILGRQNGFPITSVGVILPCGSKPEAERLGRAAIRCFNAEEIFVDLRYLEDFFRRDVLGVSGLDIQIEDILKKTGGNGVLFTLSGWNWSKKIAAGNIKARLRMITIYHIARMMNGMVLSTDNLSEHWMAFWTICGDVGDFAIIQNILKGSEAYDLARYLGVPQEIIAARPDDGLGVASGGDEDQLGASYPVLDRVILTLIQNHFNPDGDRKQLSNLVAVSDVRPELVKNLATRAINGAYKRRGTIALSRRDLGLPEIKDIKLD
ncbi:MAG: NAD(+) synthase [Patescibacteria group bacterium]|nr:NAD(+) synthase [Patescibacteria group bacterium]